MCHPKRANFFIHLSAQYVFIQNYLHLSWGIGLLKMFQWMSRDGRSLMFAWVPPQDAICGSVVLCMQYVATQCCTCKHVHNSRQAPSTADLRIYVSKGQIRFCWQQAEPLPSPWTDISPVLNESNALTGSWFAPAAWWGYLVHKLVCTFFLMVLILCSYGESWHVPKDGCQAAVHPCLWGWK